MPFTLILSLLKNHDKLFSKESELVSLMFKKAQSICRKYVQHKTSKEKIYILSCEFIILALTNTHVVNSGLNNITLPAIFGKTCYAESYLSYFFKQTYSLLKRPGIATRLLLSCKDYLLNYLKSNTEYISPALNSFHNQLIISEEPELIATIIKIIHDLFEISSYKIKLHVFIPYLLMVYHELPDNISSKLIYSTISLVPEELFNSLDPLFAGIHTNPDEKSII